MSESDTEDETHWDEEPLRDTNGLAETERLADSVCALVRDEELDELAENVIMGVREIDGEEERDSLDALSAAVLDVRGDFEAESESNTLAVEEVEEEPLKLLSVEMVDDKEADRVKTRGLTLPFNEIVVWEVTVTVPQ